MSLSLGPAFLASIAFAINSVEATPRLWRAELDKRAEFSNAPSSSTKKSTTTKKSSTTKKTTTTKKSSATSKAASTQQSSVSAASSSAAIVPSVASSAVPTNSAITDSISNTLTTQPSSTANNLVATSAAVSNNSSSGGGISGGAIGGIVAAVVIVVAGAAAYFVIARKRKNRNSTRSMSGKPDPFTMGFGSDQGFQSQMQHNQPVMTDNYQTYNNNQPGIAISSNAPYYQNNSASTQFHETNAQFAPEAMPPPALAPHQPMQPQYQPQYQPQLQPHLQPYADAEHFQADPNAVAASTTAAAAAVTAAAVTTAPAPAPATKLQPTQSGSLGVYFVVATYSPTLSDEVDIQTGDQVEVLVEYDDGWCQGINLTRGNAKGVFPKHCIESDNGAQNNNGDGDSEIDRNKRVSSMYMG